MMRSIKSDPSSVNLVSTCGERRMSTGMYVKRVVNLVGSWMMNPICFETRGMLTWMLMPERSEFSV